MFISTNELITHLSWLWLKYTQAAWLDKSIPMSIPDEAAPNINTVLPKNSSGFRYAWLCNIGPGKLSIPVMVGI